MKCDLVSVWCGGMGWDGMGWNGWDEMGWDGVGWDGMGWDLVCCAVIHGVIWFGVMFGVM